MAWKQIFTLCIILTGICCKFCIEELQSVLNINSGDDKLGLVR